MHGELVRLDKDWEMATLEGEMENPFEEIKNYDSKASELDENDFECNRLLCEINKFFEDFEQAEYYGNKASNLNPNDPRILSAMGDLFVITNRS